jgi:dihydroorotate dehydrogenase
MFNANSFLESKEYREQNFTTCPEDRPLVVQFAGHDAEQLLQACKYVEDRCDAVDINLGCPQSEYSVRYLRILEEVLWDIVCCDRYREKRPVRCVLDGRVGTVRQNREDFVDEFESPCDV